MPSKRSLRAFLGYVAFFVVFSFVQIRRQGGVGPDPGRRAQLSSPAPRPKPSGLWPDEAPDSDRILQQLAFRPQRNSERNITIFLPNGLKERKPGNHQFQLSQCPVSNCLLTEKFEESSLASAVLWEVQASAHNVAELSANRSSDQIWIYSSLESPMNSGVLTALRGGGGVNWTATYRRDSDIVTPYERFVPWDRLPPAERGKEKMVAWFVSNCHTTSGREAVAAELGSYVDVDVYGKCGPLRCGKTSARCSAALRRDYKFYLAFENSCCRDYITEKLFTNALKNDVIPVVLGGRRSDYTAVAPPNSFIHVDEFPSLRLLAAHLTRLAHNATAYNAYFQWKRMGTFVDTKYWCRLCSLLNEPKRKSYPDLAHWWNGPHICQT